MAEALGTDTRVRRLTEKRQKAKEEFERVKTEIAKQSESTVRHISTRFATKSDWADEKLKAETVGLVSFDEFQQKQLQIRAESELFDEKHKLETSDQTKVKRRKKRKRIDAAKLSFGDAEEEEQEEVEPALQHRSKKAKFGKDPTVDTSFLPDREREEFERAERRRLAQEWAEEQEAAKQRVIEISYSYWDGSGHRRTMEGTSIEQFLARVREEFRELKVVSVENLMFVKEDVIIPHHHSFYELIALKAKGKTGPLFTWDVHDDVRLYADATREKDEVVERRWYERNKHIFPASRWEVFDPRIHTNIEAVTK